MSVQHSRPTNHTSFSTTLHDWSIPWTKRLKLVRYAWMDDSVVLPNKNQFLLDLLTAAVCGKRRELSAEESAAIWRCLRDIFQTAECQSGSGHTCTVKPSFVQVLLEEVQNLASSKDIDISYCDIIISCCFSFITSPVLRLGLMAKFENALRLMTSLLRLAVRMKCLEMPEQEAPSIIALLSVSLPFYASCQRQKVSSQQVATQVSAKLLLPFLSFICYVNSQHLGNSHRKLVTDLEEIVAESLFAKDFLPHYTRYLKRKVDKTDVGWKESRFISGIFDIILTASEAGRMLPEVMNGISWLFAKFTAIYRTDDARLPLQFLRYLTESICGANMSDTSADGGEGTIVSRGSSDEGSRLSVAERFDLLHSLLEVTVMTNVYSVLNDAQQDYKIQGWLAQLTSWLLTLDPWCDSSGRFRCLHDILLLTPGAIEGHLADILACALMADAHKDSGKNNDDSEGRCRRLDSQDALLSEFVRVYFQLRQIGKLVNALLLAILHAEHQLVFPQQFITSLCQCFSELQPMAITDIWSAVNDELAAQYNKNSQDNDSNFMIVRLKAVCELMALLVANVNVVGLGVTEQVQAKVEMLLATTCQHVLSLLNNICLKHKSKQGGLCLLWLLRACGELKMLQLTYCRPSNNDGGASIDKNASETEHELFANLSLLFPSWSSRRWQKLHHFVTGSHHDELLINWEKLLLLNVKYIQQFDRTDAKLSSQVADLLLVGGHWNVDWIEAFETDTLPISQHIVEHWRIVCENVSLLFTQNDDIVSVDSHCRTVVLAKFLLFALTSRCSSPLRRTVETFVRSPTFHEMRSLHACIVSLVLGKVRRLLDTSSNVAAAGSKRRRHSSSGTEITTRILSLILDIPNLSTSDANNGTWLSQELVSSLDMLSRMNNDKTGLEVPISIDSQIADMLKALVILPLEFLSLTCQIQCILAMLVIASLQFSVSSRSVSPPASDGTGQSLKTSLRIMQLTLSDGRALQLLLSALDAGSFLGWFASLHRRTMMENSSDFELVRVFDDVFRCLLSLSMKHSASIKHLHVFVRSVLIWLRDKRKLMTTIDLDVSHTAFGILTTMIDVITKVLRRPYVQPDNRLTLLTLNDSLVREFIKSLALLYGSIPSCSPLSSAKGGTDTLSLYESDAKLSSTLSSQVLFGFSRQVEYILLYRGSSDVNLAAADRLRNKILSWLPVLCNTCLSCVCQNDENPSAHSGSLRFIVSICSCSAVLGDQLPDHFLSELWPVLMRRLSSLGIEHCAAELKPDMLRTSVKADDPATEQQDLLLTLAAMMTVFSAEEFDEYLQQIMLDMESSDIVRVIVAQRIFQQLIVIGLRSEVLDTFFHCCRKLLLILQRLLSDETSDAIVITTSFQTLTVVISNLSSSFLTAHELSVCLHLCPSITQPRLTADVGNFAVVCRSFHALLNAMLVYHSNTVFHMIPSFVSSVRQLLRAVMQAGTQQHDVDKRYTEHQLDQIADCARLFDRLVNLMSSHKVDFAKVAPYVIADYANLAQKATLYPVVKRALLLAVYKLLDICNEHTIRQLNAVLPAGAREIFRLVYAEFNKYYRYSRRAGDEEQINSDFIQYLYNS